LLSSLPGSFGSQRLGLRHQRQPEGHLLLVNGWSAPMLSPLPAVGPAPAPVPSPSPGPSPGISPQPTSSPAVAEIAPTEFQAEGAPWPEWPVLAASPSPAPPPAPSSGLVTTAPGACEQLASLIGAMSCSMVTQVTGGTDGCECHLQGTICPSAHAGLGFTALSPSSPIELPDEKTSVILCMYWQLHKPPSQAVELRARQLQAESWTVQLVDQARTNAEAEANSRMPEISLQAPAPAPHSGPHSVVFARSPAPSASTSR